MGEKISSIQVPQCLVKNILPMFEKYSGGCMFYLDFAHDYYYISEVATKQYKLKADMFYGDLKKLLRFIYKEDYSLVRSEFEQIRAGKKKKHSLNYRCYNGEGKVVWVHSIGELAYDAFGKASIFIGQVNLSQWREKIQGSRFAMKLVIGDWKELMNQYSFNRLRQAEEALFHGVEKVLTDDLGVYRLLDGQLIILGKERMKKESVKTLFEKINHTKSEAFSDYVNLYGSCMSLEDADQNESGIMKRLDFSMECAKKHGGTALEFYEESNYELYVKTIDMKENLCKAVNEDFREFEVYYQPIVNAENLQISGAEALLRWNSEKYGRISPCDFIPLLEETGLIIPVGRWVLHQALNQCKEWQKYIPAFRINVNLSYIQLKQCDISNDLVKELKHYDLNSKYVMLELTESGHVEKDSQTRHMMKHLQKMKVKLAIDDFGTGYSNLCYLKDMKIYVVKIDRSFAMNCLTSPYHYKLLSHIIEMAHSVNLKVCLEGIETEAEQRKFLPLEPDYFQGYLFGKPVSAEVFLKQINVKESSSC